MQTPIHDIQLEKRWGPFKSLFLEEEKCTLIYSNFELNILLFNYIFEEKIFKRNKVRINCLSQQAA